MVLINRNMSRNLFIVLWSYIVICASCSKREEAHLQSSPIPDTTNSSISDSNYYYSFFLDSVNYRAIAFVNNYSLGTYGGNHFTGAAITPPGYGIFSGNTSMDTTGFSVVIGNIPDTESLSAFYDSLRPRNLPFGKSAGDGVVVDWVDGHGVLWSTILGSADQSGSNLAITAHNYNNVDSVFIIISAGFNCNLYDSAGDMRSLTNGLARLEFLGP